MAGAIAGRIEAMPRTHGALHKVAEWLSVDTVVSQLAPGNVSVAIVQAMVTLAHALHIDVTAEGVETHEQAKVLNDLGCNVYQGFLFSAAVTPIALENLLRQPRSQVA